MSAFTAERMYAVRGTGLASPTDMAGVSQSTAPTVATGKGGVVAGVRHDPVLWLVGLVGLAAAAGWVSMSIRVGEG